jgi:hypothetical protein
MWSQIRMLGWRWWAAVAGLLLAVIGVVTTPVPLFFAILGLLSCLLLLSGLAGSDNEKGAGAAARTVVAAVLPALPAVLFGVLLALTVGAMRADGPLENVPDTTALVDELPDLPQAEIVGPDDQDRCLNRPSTRVGSFHEVDRAQLVLGERELTVTLTGGNTPDLSNFRGQVEGAVGPEDAVWLDITREFAGDQRVQTLYEHGMCGRTEVGTGGNTAATPSFVIDRGPGHAVRACASGPDAGAVLLACTDWHAFR